MIRKMLAMLVAISCAFGAWADTHISGTDFTGLTAGPFALGLDDEGQASNSTFWYNGDESDFEGTIIDGGSANYLDFESNITNPLYRTINDSYGLAPSSFQATPIGTGLFIDTHVQFTPYLVNENHPEPTKVTNDDKLIVWVRETEVDGDANITNLIITAGYIAGNGNVSASNYVANLSSAAVSALCDGQHRLTIKSYQNITAHSGVTVMGFVVYVDETVVEYIGDAFADGSVFLPLVPGPAQYYSQGGGHNKLLPCLMDYGTDPSAIDSYSKLTAVGYAGMGKIGDVIFDSYNTTYPAFAGDDLAFQVVLGDGVTSFDYLGETYETNASFTVDATATSVTISNVQYDTSAGYTHKTGTWHNNVAVDNQVGEGGDYGTFLFANGTILTLVGFQANYIVNGVEFDTLLGENGALAAALEGGYTLVLNNDVEITEGDGCLYLGSGDTLVLDLKGHTIKGTGDEYTPTIINNGGTLTIVDTSSNQDGKVLNNDNSNLCLGSYSGSTTTLNAGIYEDIDIFEGVVSTITIGGGTYKDADATSSSSTFYLQQRIASGKEVTDWNLVDGYWYATIGIAGGITWDITFSTNNVVVTEWNLTVDDGDPIGNHIPNFTGGSWDAPAPTAETVVNSDTNFNYTIPYTLTYVTAHGVTPDGATYTNGAPNFALAAAPTADGWSFGGWLIGSDVFEAGDTFVVADHLENTTATAVWTPVTYTLTYTTEHGDAPAAVSYTVESNNFALAAAPDPGVVGVAFAGWVIGSVTNEAGATFVVADHLANTIATAAWVTLAPPAYFPQTDIDPSSPYAGRDGTPAKPFVIRNLPDLNAFKTYVEDGTFASSSFEVVSNITATGWIGVGTEENKFAGTLNGGGKTISLAFADAKKYNGLFRYVSNATISNLTVNVTAAVSVSGSTGGAAFVGQAYGSCTFETLKATGSLGLSGTPVTHNAAGICASIAGGTSADTVTFNCCTNAMDIYANYTKVGGILAFVNGPASTINFNNCVNLGNISNVHTEATTDKGTGGLMGWSGYYCTININGFSNSGMITAVVRPANVIGDAHIVPTVTGVNTGLASIKSCDAYSAKTIPGLDWATVDGDVATFVTPVTTVESAVAYKYMREQKAGEVTGFTLAAAAASLTIDTSLAAYTGTVSVAAALAEDYNLRQTAIATGVIYSLESKTPADPWAPAEQTDEAAATKIAQLFPGSEVAANVTTYTMYTNLVDYIKDVTSSTEVPTDLTENQVDWLWKSYILGADPLFVAEPEVEITSLTAGSTAGVWKFTVQVTDGTEVSPAVHEVVADKVKALVKTRTSLTSGSWGAPATEDISAKQLPGGNTIEVTIDFGDGTSGFMKVSE